MGRSKMGAQPMMTTLIALALALAVRHDVVPEGDFVEFDKGPDNEQQRHVREMEQNTHQGKLSSPLDNHRSDELDHDQGTKGKLSSPLDNHRSDELDHDQETKGKLSSPLDSHRSDELDHDQ